MNNSLLDNSQVQLSVAPLCMSNKLPQVIPNFSNVSVICRIKKPTQAEMQTQQSSSFKAYNQSGSRNQTQRQTSQTHNSFRHQSKQQIRSPSASFKSGSNNLSGIIRRDNNRSLSNQANRTSIGLNNLRKDSSISNNQNSSMTPGRSQSQTKQNSHKSSLLENFDFSIFTTLEKSPFVITSEDTLIKGKTLTTFLISQNDIPSFTTEHITEGNKAQLYIFDSVINESNLCGQNQSLYSQQLRNDIHKLLKRNEKQVNGKIQSGNLCYLMFGPTDSNEKHSKISQLLTTKSDGKNSNVALKSIFDYFTIRETIFKDNNSQIKVQVIQINQIGNQMEVHDLLIYDHQKQSFIIQPKGDKEGVSQKKYAYLSTSRPIRSVQDFCQCLRVAQQNRNILAKQLKMEPSDLKNKSHLILRLNTSQSNTIDFVELCGSEQAANSISTHLVGKHIDQQRKFATQSFNSLSTLITKFSCKNTEHTPLTHILQETINQFSKIVFCCSVSPSISQFRHSVTAIKFCSKIREVIAKKFLKESKILANLKNEFISINQNIERFQSNQNESQQLNEESQWSTIKQFQTLRNKYEQIIKESKTFGEVLQDHQKYLQLDQIKSEFSSIKEILMNLNSNQKREDFDCRIKIQEVNRQSPYNNVYSDREDFNKVHILDSSRQNSNRSNSQAKRQLIPHPPIHNNNYSDRKPDNFKQNIEQILDFNFQSINITAPTPEFKHIESARQHFSLEQISSHKKSQDQPYFNQNKFGLIDYSTQLQTLNSGTFIEYPCENPFQTYKSYNNDYNQSIVNTQQTNTNTVIVHDDCSNLNTSDNTRSSKTLTPQEPDFSLNITASDNITGITSNPNLHHLLPLSNQPSQKNIQIHSSYNAANSNQNHQNNINNNYFNYLNSVNHSNLPKNNSTLTMPQSRLTSESQKLLEKYREAKKAKQERERSNTTNKQNSTNRSNSQQQQNSQNINYSSDFQTSENTTQNLHQSFDLNQKYTIHTAQQQFNEQQQSFDQINQSQTQMMMTEDVMIKELQVEIQKLKLKLNEQTLETQTLKQALQQNRYGRRSSSEQNINQNDSQMYDEINMSQEQSRVIQLQEVQSKVDNDQYMHLNYNIIQDMEKKLDIKNEQIAKMLQQKQMDQKDLQELRFKLDREISQNEKLTQENQTLKSKIENLQRKYVEQENKYENQVREIIRKYSTSQAVTTTITDQTNDKNERNASQRYSDRKLSQDRKCDEMRSEMMELRLEVETIKRQKNSLQLQYDEIVQQVNQLERVLVQKDNQIDSLTNNLNDIKAKSFDSVNLIQKQSEFDVRMLQFQNQLQQAQKAKKQAEDEMFMVRDKLREVLSEKIQLENQLNQIERVEDTRITELEIDLQKINQNYENALEDNKQLRQKESDLRRDLILANKARDAFKEQFLELREFNKDLKHRFIEIERQVQELMIESSNNDSADKENQKKISNNQKREGILSDIQGLIKDYKRNAHEKKIRYSSGTSLNRSGVNSSAQYSSSGFQQQPCRSSSGVLTEISSSNLESNTSMIQKSFLNIS